MSDAADRISMRRMELMTGVSHHTLRAWEKRYRAVEPVRSANGRREYSVEDVERILLIVKLLEVGHSIGNIGHLSKEELAELGQNLPLPKPDRPLGVVEKILRETQNYQPARIDLMLTQSSALLNVPTFILDVVAPLLTEVGLRVADGRLNVAQEHMLSGVLRNHFGRIHPPFAGAGAAGAAMVFAAPEGNLHEFGILSASILASLRGRKVYYLGANLPAKDLIGAMAELDAKILVIGASRAPSDKLTPTFFSELDKSLSTRIEVWLGGEAAWDAHKKFRRREVVLLGSLREFEERVRG